MSKTRVSQEVFGSPVKEGALFLICAALSLFILLLLMGFILHESWPFLLRYGPAVFAGGASWYPAAHPPEYGILPLVAGSVAVAGVAGILAVPVSLLTAVYLAEVATPTAAFWTRTVLRFMASIPTVVLGLIGFTLLGPAMQQWFGLRTGLNLFTAGILLGFSVIPTIALLAAHHLSSVPLQIRQASVALGATSWETLRRVVMPSCRRGLFSACLAGFSRVTGETMIVLMVAGGAAAIPHSLFDPVRPLTATIGAEMAEAVYQSEHYHALFAVGLVLLFISLGVNVWTTRLDLDQEGGR